MRINPRLFKIICAFLRYDPFNVVIGKSSVTFTCSPHCYLKTLLTPRNTCVSQHCWFTSSSGFLRGQRLELGWLRIRSLFRHTGLILLGIRNIKCNVSLLWSKFWSLKFFIYLTFTKINHGNQNTVLSRNQRLINLL